MHNLILRTIVFCAAALSYLTPDHCCGEPPDIESGKVFVGYLYGEPRDIKFALYTHLCHAFVVADENGVVRPNRNVPNRKLAADAHDAGVKILISLGGWGWDKQFAAMAENPEAEDRYVQAVMKMVDEFDYDGIDLDWEYPDTEKEIVGFERLAGRFRKQLDELGQRKDRHLLQTMAVSANPGTVKWLSTECLLANMDWINVMTYDYAGGWTSYAGHHSPLYASSKQPGRSRHSAQLTMDYLLDKRRIPANRLALGIPLYGRGFHAPKPYAPKKDAGSRRIPRGNYSNLHQLQRDPDWMRLWDDETKNPWLLSRDGTVVIGYDNAKSVAMKANWAMEKGFRGVFFWQINADRLPDGSNPLQEAARKELDRER